MSLGQRDRVALIDLGVVRGAYGVKGWVKIAPFSPDAAVLMKAREWWLTKEGSAPLQVTVETARRHSGNIIAKWSGFDVPERGDALKGATVAVDRAAFPPLPDGEIYWVDLIGARVVNRAGVELGEVKGVQNNGAQDLMSVTSAAGAVLLIPMVAEFIDAVDAQDGVIRVDWDPDWV